MGGRSVPPHDFNNIYSCEVEGGKGRMMTDDDDYVLCILRAVRYIQYYPASPSLPMFVRLE